MNYIMTRDLIINRDDAKVIYIHDDGDSVFFIMFENANGAPYQSGAFDTIEEARNELENIYKQIMTFSNFVLTKAIG